MYCNRTASERHQRDSDGGRIKSKGKRSNGWGTWVQRGEAAGTKVLGYQMDAAASLCEKDFIWGAEGVSKIVCCFCVSFQSECTQETAILSYWYHKRKNETRERETSFPRSFHTLENQRLIGFVLSATGKMQSTSKETPVLNKKSNTSGIARMVKQMFSFLCKIINF